MNALEKALDACLEGIEIVGQHNLNEQQGRKRVRDAFEQLEKDLKAEKPQPYELGLGCPKCGSEVLIKMHQEADHVRWKIAVDKKKEVMLKITLDGQAIYEGVVKATTFSK